MNRIAITLAIAAAVTAHAQDSRSVRVVTDSTGTYLVRADATASRAWRYGPEGALWTHPEPVAIPESVSLSQSTSMAWVGETLNQERMQRFTLPGSGIPAAKFPMGFDSPARVSAAAGADLAVILDKSGGPFTVRAFRSTSGTELWSRELGENYDGADIKPIKVSRNGAIVVVYLTDSVHQTSELYILDGPTGAHLRSWVYPSWGGCVDLTDNGGLALVAQSFNGRVIDTATGQEVFTAPANGAGGRFNISGDGSILVLGGFDLRVFKRPPQGATWLPAFTFGAPNSWFGWGSAVSRDNSTIGVMSHDYMSNYLITATRIFDITGALLGTHPTVGAGGLQDSIAGAAISDNGAVFAVASWGDQANTHPEVMVFNRSATLIGSVDTPGSPFGLDMTGDGRYVLVGSKAVHANTFGNGGQVTLLDNPVACYPDCNGDGALTAPDFGCFQTRFVAADPYADCNGDGVRTAADFGCFQTRFVAACP